MSSVANCGFEELSLDLRRELFTEIDLSKEELSTALGERWIHLKDDRGLIQSLARIVFGYDKEGGEVENYKMLHGRATLLSSASPLSPQDVSKKREEGEFLGANILLYGSRDDRGLSLFHLEEKVGIVDGMKEIVIDISINKKKASVIDAVKKFPTSKCNLSVKEAPPPHIPIEVSILKNLEVLTLDHPRAIIDNPLLQAIGSLKKLREITLVSINHIEALPEKEWTWLKNLEKAVLDIHLATFPSFMCSYPSLTHLTIGPGVERAHEREHYPLKTVSSRGWGFEKLSFLDLSGNSLENFSSGFFPGARKLKKLYLDRNFITTIQKNIFVDWNYLEELNIGNNRLTKIPREVVNLHSLRVLSLFNNPFSEEAREELEKNLNYLRKVKILQVNFFQDFSFNVLKPGDTSYKTFRADWNSSLFDDQPPLIQQDGYTLIDSEPM